MVIERSPASLTKRGSNAEIVDPWGWRKPTRHADRRNLPMARGHSAKLPAGRRFVIPATTRPTRWHRRRVCQHRGRSGAVLRAARSGGAAQRLSAASRREMTRRQWQDPHSSFDSWYGSAWPAAGPPIATGSVMWRLPGLYHPHLGIARTGLAILDPDQRQRRWAICGGRDHADPLLLRQARRADGAGQGLERAVVDARRRNRLLPVGGRV